MIEAERTGDYGEGAASVGDERSRWRDGIGQLLGDRGNVGDIHVGDVADLSAVAGNEDRHFVRAFLGKEPPLLTWDDGLDVVKILMAAYQSAEQGKTLAFPPKGLDRFVPAVARGTWRP